MKNKFLKILVFIVPALMLSGCGILNQNQNRYSYNDNKIIANEADRGSAVSLIGSPIKNGKKYSKVKKIDGVFKILEANINKDTNVTLHINMVADSGKGKLVLVKPNSEVEILAEVISGKESNHFEGNVSIKCDPGNNKIKIVGENYGGNFEIQQPNEVIFNDTDEIKDKIDDNMNNMFDENFPFETNTH